MADIDHRKKTRQPNRPYPKLRKLYRRIMVDVREQLGYGVHSCESNHIAEFDPRREITRLQRQAAALDVAIDLMHIAIGNPEAAERHADAIWKERSG